MSNRRKPKKENLAAGPPGTRITLKEKPKDKPVKRNYSNSNPRDQMIVPRSVVEEFPTKTGRAG